MKLEPGADPIDKDGPIGYVDGQRMKIIRETSQAMQRARVGLIGLVAVILLIGVASAIMRAVTRERPVVAVGTAQPDIVANMGIANAIDAGGEPLADLGVTASTGNTVATPAR